MWFGDLSGREGLRLLGIYPAVFFLIGMASIIASIAAAVMFYLQTGFKRESKDSDPTDFYPERDQILVPLTKVIDRVVELESEVHHLHRGMSEIAGMQNTAMASQTALTEEQKKALITSVKEHVHSKAAEEVLTELRKQIASADKTTSVTKHALEQFGLTVRRLNDEVAALSRRGNLNLVLGILTTGVGLAALGYFVVKFHGEGSPSMNDLVGFVPRLSLVVFIELFAYFFLRLYKSSLAEIKFFQNELTNVEAKAIALEVSALWDNAAVVGSVIERIAGTERNNVLQAGQTTVELEQAKLHDEKLVDLVKELLAALRPPGKGSG